jgi:transposase
VSERGVIVFADEVGFTMNPCVKNTWAPVGKTPVVVFRNRHHRKVSAIGAIALEPSGKLGVHIHWHPDHYVRGEEAAAFVRHLLATFNAPVTLVWDKLQAHRSKLIAQLRREHPRLRVAYLPSYAPDLNPVETLWCLTKHHRMANHHIDNLPQLLSEAQRHVHAVAAEQTLLRSCFASAGLALKPPSAQ